MKKLLCLSTLALLASCGGGSGGGGGAGLTSDFNETYELLTESAPAMGAALIENNYVESLFGDKTSITNALWSNATTTFQGVSSSQTNPKGYVSDLFDESVDQSILERARMPFLISCCLDILASKTGDQFTAGTQTVTFTSAVVGVCGSASEFSGMIGNNITIVVTDLNDTTNYDQMIFFDHATNPLFSDSDQWMYVRNSNSVLNFMHIEDSSAGFNGASISVSSIAFDKDNDSGYFQYVTKSTNDVRLFRVFMDVVADDARIFGYKYNPGGSNESVSVNAASTFEDQDYAALSMSWVNQQAPYNADLADGNACIATANGSISSDNTLTCAGNSKTVIAVSNAAAIQTAAQGINGATIRSDAAAGNLADNLPSFNAGTILSAALQL